MEVAMKAGSLRWTLLAYFVLLIFAVENRAHRLAGLGPTWLDGNYGFEAGPPPWSLAIGVTGVGLFIALISSSVDEAARPMPHLFRRWIAGWIDWILAFVVPAPFAGLGLFCLNIGELGFLSG
jgi:hypothetical protein